MLIKLSWKNIWRNKIRSGVILGAIAIGLFAGTYLSAFMNGWLIGSVQTDIDNNLSYLQICDTSFTANNDIGAFFIKGEVEDKCKEVIDCNVSSSLNLTGMLSSAAGAAGVTATGVNMDEYRQVFTLWETIPDSLSSFLPDEGRNPIVISTKTAEKLKVRLHSKIVFSFPDLHGEMQTAAFRVCGMFKTDNTAYDESTVFVRYSDILPLTALPENAVHKTYIRVADLETCDRTAPQFKAAFPALSVQTWKEINPMYAMSLQWMDLFAIIIIGIFLFALAFGIVNTMLMAVLERTREIGMLAAIGMSRSKIFRMIMLETVLLTLLGSIIGILLAVAVLIPSMHSGIDLTFMIGDSFEDYGFSSVVYPSIDMKMFVEIVIMVIAAGILAALYPAKKALKTNVVEAIKS
jgi:ABC-type lipoprotein release transport system permease subunit